MLYLRHIFLSALRTKPKILNIPKTERSHSHNSSVELICNRRFYNRGRETYSKASHTLVLGGILSFLGLDEDSKRDRQYEKEVESTKEEDFDEKLKNVLRPAIFSMQVIQFQSVTVI